MTTFIQLTIGILLAASICRYYNITRLIWKVLDYIYFVMLTILFINLPIVAIYGRQYSITQHLIENYPDHTATLLWCIVFTYSYIRLIVDMSEVIAIGLSRLLKGQSPFIS
jgi:TctA family transporter